MMPRIAFAYSLTASLLVAPLGMAEEYDFEVEIGYSSVDFESSQTITTDGGVIFNSSEIDTDELRLSGTWFFKGLSDEKGPRSRAALTDRASSARLGYSQADRTFASFLSNTDPAFPFPPIDSRIESDDDAFAVDIRYINRNSGWIGSAGLLTSDATVGAPVSSSFDATGWRLGFGKYVSQNTTLELAISGVDVDGGSDTSGIGVTFEHLGDLTGHWQYAVDLAYNRINPDAGSDVDTWRAALALYPNKDIEFGLALEDVSGDLVSGNNLGVEGFASWFVRPNVRLAARYRVDDVDYQGNAVIGGAPTAGDADQDSFGVSATVRF